LIQGIYEILNTKNNKSYIGSSKNIDKRWKEHKKMLKDNKHHSIKLQRSYNKVKDKNVFEYNIIEIVEDDSILHKREQYYIDKYDSFKNGYNCSMVDSVVFTTKSLSKKQRKIKQEIYYNNFMELYETYNNNIVIFKTYINRLQGMHYSWIQYNKVIQLILEYEKYFTNDYYIRLYGDKYIIESYDREPLVSYLYKYKQNKIYIDMVCKDGLKLYDEELKQYEYR
jgi:hypothetical protein